MSLSKQEFTNAGKSMLGRAQNAERLTISKIVVGNGGATQPSDLWPLTALIGWKMDVVISRKQDYGTGTLLIEGSLRSDQAPSAFDLHEVGVMAHIGAEADRLYSVANSFADPVDHIDPAAATIQVFKIKLIIDRIPTANLTVSIGPSENVIGSNLGLVTDGPGVYKDALGNVLNFKRLVQGYAMDIHEVPDTVNPTGIYIGTSTIKNDLDLYVPAGYPGISDPNIIFPTIQAAHDHLLQYFIPADKFARIHVWKGTYAKANFTHPNSMQISLHGWPRVDKPIQTIDWLDNTPTAQPPIDTVAVGGSSGHKRVTLVTGTDVTDLAVGQIVYLAVCNFGWVGGCKITAKSGLAITCDVPDQSNQSQHYTTQSARASFPNQRLSYLPTVVQWVNPVPGQRPQEHCLAFPYGIRLVENILVIGGHSAFGAGADMWLKNCMAYHAIGGCGSFTGMCATGTAGADPLGGDYVATNCEQGSGGPGMLWHTENTMINGCGNGIVPGYNGCALASINASLTTWWLYANHCGVGLRIGLNASAYGSHFIYGCNDFGIYADMGGFLNFGILDNAPFQNTQFDIAAFRRSYLIYKKGAGAAPSCNPAANPGPTQGWIEVIA